MDGKTRLKHVQRLTEINCGTLHRVGYTLRAETCCNKALQQKKSCDWRPLSFQREVATKNKNFKKHTNISEAACSNVKSDKKLTSIHAEVEGTNVKHLKTLQSKLMYNWE